MALVLWTVVKWAMNTISEGGWGRQRIVLCYHVYVHTACADHVTVVNIALDEPAVLTVVVSQSAQLPTACKHTYTCTYFL